MARKAHERTTRSQRNTSVHRHGHQRRHATSHARTWNADRVSGGVSDGFGRAQQSRRVVRPYIVRAGYRSHGGHRSPQVSNVERMENVVHAVVASVVIQRTVAAVIGCGVRHVIGHDLGRHCLVFERSCGRLHRTHRRADQQEQAEQTRQENSERRVATTRRHAEQTIESHPKSQVFAMTFRRFIPKGVS